MSDPVSLAPSNATPLMQAVSLANAERRPIAPARLADLWDPMRAPEQSLPYLAAAHGVSVWRTDWTEDRKREVIARSIALKRRRGTLACFEEHLGFVDATLLRVVAPPQIAVACVSITAEQRTAWLAQFPELRVYHFRDRGHQLGVMTPGRWLTGILTARDSRGAVYSGQTASVFDHGVERSAVVQAASGASEFAQTVQIALPTTGRRCVLGPASAGFLTPLASNAAERLFTFRTGASGQDTVRPGLAPIDVRPERVAARQAGVAAFASGQPLGGPFRFATRSRARENIYDSIRLYDPAKGRAGKFRHRAGIVPGFTRLGQPAFHLELAVDLSFRRRKALRLPHLPGFVEAHDSTRTDEAMAAVRAAKLGRDKVEVQTALHRRITAGDGIPLNGTVRLGQIIRSL